MRPRSSSTSSAVPPMTRRSNRAYSTVVSLSRLRPRTRPSVASVVVHCQLPIAPHGRGPRRLGAAARVVPHPQDTYASALAYIDQKRPTVYGRSARRASRVLSAARRRWRVSAGRSERLGRRADRRRARHLDLGAAVRDHEGGPARRQRRARALGTQPGRAPLDGEHHQDHDRGRRARELEAQRDGRRAPGGRCGRAVDRVSGRRGEAARCATCSRRCW